MRNALITAALVFLQTVAIVQPAAAERVRVAVLGDSLSTWTRWPASLAKHLGDGYEVKAFAAGGMTLVRGLNPRSVWKRYEARHAQDYRPHVVLMMFGIIEGKPKGWRRDAGAFAAGYKELIRVFQRLKPAPKIYLLQPVAGNRDAFGNNRQFVTDNVVPAIARIARETGAACLDTHTPFIGRPDANDPWDGLHPNKVGGEIIARIVTNALTGSKLALPPKPREPTAEEIAAEEARLAVKAKHVMTMDVGDAAELTPAAVADPKGDGPDGKGNTEDDTWQFWFGFFSGGYHRLNLCTATMPPAQRANGVFDPNARRGHRKKVTGPIAADLPNPDHTNGWILGTDWNGRFEGFWGDLKAGQILAHPYVEKSNHGSVSVTFRVPADGAYDIHGKITDLQVVKFRRHTGVTWAVEIAKERVGRSVPKARTVAGRGGPVGDKVGPDSAAFEVKAVPCNKGDLIRLVIDPNEWWGTDLTRIDHFRIQRVR